jgi:hypothetical protein
MTLNNTHKFLTYSLFLTTSTAVFSMNIAITKFCSKKITTPRYSTIINKSKKLDSIRQAFSINNSPQNIKDISQGIISIKEEIPLGKRYGVCHNYAFTKLMGIVGKAPSLLNITGQREYYAANGINILNFFEPAPKDNLQLNDVIIFVSTDTWPDSISQITHTGIVISDDRIESKWGPIPAVFEHPTWYVPQQFGNNAYYLRPKITGNALLQAVQKKLQKKSVKKIYDSINNASQQALFALINQPEDENYYYNKIYSALEYNMNIHINVPDENGLTALMHAERLGYERLIDLFTAYEKFNE